MRTFSDIGNIIEETPWSLPAALIMIKTKSGRVELREDRGNWLVDIYEDLKSKSMLECRSTWDEMYLFSPEIQVSEFERTLVSKIEKLSHFHLDVYLLVTEIEGTSSEKIKTLKEMQLQLLKLDYWDDHLFDSYYKNGCKIDLKKS